MAYFRRKLGSYNTLPEIYSSSILIDVQQASITFPHKHQHTNLRYKRAKLTSQDSRLEELTAGQMIGQQRNMSPRTRDFTIRWKDRCSAMLRMLILGKKKKTMREIEHRDGEVQSRWEKIHGPDGLCSALVEVFNAMAEIRMKAEYGDYLAYTCSAWKDDTMNDMRWKF